jgi:hypothetical protein
MIFKENLIPKDFDLISEIYIKSPTEMLLFQIEPF